MKMDNLRQFITDNIEKSQNDPYYNESFCNLTAEYYGSKGEFSDADVKFLNDNGYSPLDFEKGD